MSLTAEELDGMRVTSAEWMTDSCAIQEFTVTDDQMGGSTRAWQIITGLEAVPCRWGEPTSAGERQIASAIQSGAAVVLSVPWDTPIAAKHRVVHQDGTTAEVEAVLRPQTDPIVLRAVCRTVT